VNTEEWKPTHYVKEKHLFGGFSGAKIEVELGFKQLDWAEVFLEDSYKKGTYCIVRLEHLIPITSEPPSVSERTKSTTAPHGGPSDYYDFDKGFCTANDIMEFLASDRWLGDALHMKDIFKACFRWGKKEGTSKEYDAKKIIYSAARLLRQYSGQEEMRAYLQSLLDDKQFAGKS
jgi:hypothetical protein